MNAKIGHRNNRIRQVIEQMDLTNLSENCDQAAIEQLCSQAITPVGSVAAFCVWPEFVVHARQYLADDGAINIATAGNCSGGADATDACLRQIEKAVADSATEIDYVIPVGRNT